MAHSATRPNNLTPEPCPQDEPKDGESQAAAEATPAEPSLPFPVSVLKRVINEDKDIKRCSADGIRAIAFATVVPAALSHP